MAGDFTVTRDGEATGAFVLHEAGRDAGRLDFHLSGQVLVIDFVLVDPRLRGSGLGVRLVDAAIAWARETGRTVRPHCGYAARVLRRDTAYRDVLEPDAF